MNINEGESSEPLEDEPARRRRRTSRSPLQEEQLERAELRGCAVAILVVVALIIGIVYLRSGGEEEEVTSVSKKETHTSEHLPEPTAEEVARAFIAESDVEKRLEMVRNPELISGHLSRYADEALKEPGVELRHIGGRTYGEMAKSSYAVSFESGDLRLLNVLETDEGLKVDWDSYARYCSVGWEELTAEGASGSAVVRVFVRPASHYVGAYVDQTKWVCFMLETPDTKESLYAYGRVGEDVTTRMKEAVLRAKNYRQHMTLELAAKGKLFGVSLFEVSELRAVGWVE